MGKNESLESAIKRFKKQLDRDGTLKEYKDRQYFKKPSLVRHEKSREIEHKLNKIKSK